MDLLGRYARDPPALSWLGLADGYTPLTAEACALDAPLVFFG
jgi:hypothetical protein